MDWQRMVLGGGPVGAGSDWATKKVFGDAYGGIINTAAPWNITNPQAYKEGHQGTMHALGQLGGLIGGGGGQPAASGGQNPYSRGYAHPGQAQAPMMTGGGQQQGQAPTGGGMMGAQAPISMPPAAVGSMMAGSGGMAAGGYQSPYAIGQPYGYGGWGGYGMA